jgi:hypothetical protein
LAGCRDPNNGSLILVGTIGYCWSSTVSGIYSLNFNFYSSYTNMGTGNRASGIAVRCLKEVTLVGAISTLNCATATNNGTLTAGVAASGVSFVVPYTGGNGGAHVGQVVASTGVTGLTATSAAGAFANGNGNLTFTISGTPSAAGTASFALNIGGQSCVLSRSVTSGGSYPAGSVFCASGPAAVVDVTNPATGKTWMDRNLGASQVATFPLDTSAYGDLYQWGRGSDGHQCRNSPTTSTLSSTDQPGHGSFIRGPYNDSFDWRSPKNDNLWQGVNGINNPCPAGYRLPTEPEMENERLSWSPPRNLLDAFASPLKWAHADYRCSDGILICGGILGSYHTSSVNGLYSRRIIFGGVYSLMTDCARQGGHSVRCIKD